MLRKGWVWLGPGDQKMEYKAKLTGVTRGPFLLCALLLLPQRLLWGSPLSAKLPRPHTLPSFPHN